MNIAVRYYTRSGNTKKLASAVADAVSAEAKDITAPLTEKVNILFLGCSYYAFDVDEAVKQFIVENKDYIGKIVCFGTSAMNYDELLEHYGLIAEKVAERIRKLCASKS